ncbi:MAG: 6-carboxytetrahydropterin synthase [Pseudomonadota bacterium]
MTQLYYLASAQFEAACQMNNLDKQHRAAKLHGHSYQVSMRVAEQNNNLSSLAKQIKSLIQPLDYSFLNDHITIPSDENIARWILSNSNFNNTDQVAVQSTLNSGVDLDRQGDAHIWRRYRFEAAHQLPNVPEGHQCGRMHGHGFEVILHVNQELHNQAMGIDFDELDRFWQPLHQLLNNRCLNNIRGLENPTSEVLANWIWQKLKPQLDSLSWVTVYETHTSGCNYNGSQYRIWKEQFFESAILHPEPLTDSSLTGHSYKIRLHLMAELDKVMGWTVDYGDVKSLFNPVYKQLDHHRLDHLEQLPQADIKSLLYWIKDRIATQLSALDRIDLFEQPGYGAQLCWGKEGPALPD